MSVIEENAHVHVLPSVNKKKFLLTILTKIQIKGWWETKEEVNLGIKNLSVHCDN